MPVSRETPFPLPHLPREIAVMLDSLAVWTAERAFPLGLTNYRTPDTVLRDAILPALALSNLLGATPVGPWAEIGAGSGALGLALALTAPAVHVDLVDRRQRAVDFMDLTVRRLVVPNARAVHLDLQPRTRTDRWVGVCFRALAQPGTALALAARHARRWICVWHSPTVAGYSTPPGGFSVASQQATVSPNLVATLYARGS